MHLLPRAVSGNDCPMLSSFRLLLLASLIAGISGVCPAQDAAGWIEELRELRKTVEVQSKQIEALTQQVARLNAALESRSSAPVATPPPSPASAASATATHSPSEFNPPPAPDPANPRHVVMKGETLTSIAKLYNIPIGDLQKANKDVNERKLQIGQFLILPPNAQLKSPNPPAEPTPNP
jgi:LysM repeat protein